MQISTFPLIKRFKDVQLSESTVIIKSDMTFNGKCFRNGTIFFVLGWREINNIPYLILSRGSWEGLIKLESIKDKIENLI